MAASPMKQHASSSSDVHHDNGDGSSTNNDPIFDLFPPGYRFNPSDEELVVYYLKRKVLNVQLPPNKIADVNLYKYNPEALADMYKPLGERQWYFFTPRDRKYKNGNRPDRSAGVGYWKATGADKAIKSNGECIGFRKALVFYKGKPATKGKGDKTTWIMHEFKVNMPPKSRSGTDMRLDDWVLCRIYNKEDKAISLRARQHDDESPTQQLDDAIETQESNGQLVPVGELPMPSNESSTHQQLDDAIETQESHGQLVPVGELPMPSNESSTQFNQIEPSSYNSDVDPMAFFNPSDIRYLDQFESKFAEGSQSQVPAFGQTPILSDHYPTMNNTGYNSYQNDIKMVEPGSSQLPNFSMESNIRPQLLSECPLGFTERGYQEEQWGVPKLDSGDFLTESDFYSDQFLVDVENDLSDNALISEAFSNPDQP